MPERRREKSSPVVALGRFDLLLGGYLPFEETVTAISNLRLLALASL